MCPAMYPACVIYNYSMHTVCHAATNLMFGSCMALLNSSPVIDTCHCRDRESVSDSISVIEVLASIWLGLCTHYIDDLVPYEHAATGDVVPFFFSIKSTR